MAKKYIYIRLDYESLWVNNHGSCVEMDPYRMEQLVKTMLEDTCPLKDMKAKVQFGRHKNIKIPRNCG